MKRAGKFNTDNKRSKRKRSDNERAVWNNYMSSKHSKLDNQFATDGDNGNSSSSSKIFEGVSIYVNGYTDPSSEQLKMMMKANGGIFHNYNSRGTTHIIATNLPDSKVRAIRDLKVVRPEWITESLAAGKLLDHKPYLLYGHLNASQPTLNFDVGANKTSNRTPIKKPVAESKNTKIEPESRNVDSLRISVASATAGTSKDDCASPSVSGYVAGTVVRRVDATVSSFPKTGDANFLSEFYGHSRLHYISTAQLELREHVHRLREDSDGDFPGRRKLLERPSTGRRSMDPSDGGDRRVIMHVDMDCFFVSVGVRNRPDLKGLPVAVSHSTGANGESSNAASMSEIASCNYECRKFGVKNGMLLGKARNLCPGLVTIPYDFGAYKQVGEQLYNVVATYTLDIEAVSCDELIVDCTSVLKETKCSPEELGASIRDDVRLQTKCCCSIGIGRNFLMAKMATRKAKPDGLFHIQSAEEESIFMKEEDVRNVPGIGRVLEKQLNAIGVFTCGELQTFSEKALKERFGPTKGANLYRLCRGIDDRRIEFNRLRQSVSAEINYGIRFEKYEDVPPFLANVAEEIRGRLQKAGAKGKQITLKIKLRQADAPVKTAKFMGHGLVDNLSKGVSLASYTNDSAIITKECETLLQQMKLNVKDIRGIGVQVTKLDLENRQRDPQAPSIKSFLKPSSGSSGGQSVIKKVETAWDNHRTVDTNVDDRRAASTRPNKTTARAKEVSPRKTPNKTKPSPKKNVSPLKEAPYKYTTIDRHFQKDKPATKVETVKVVPVNRVDECLDNLASSKLDPRESVTSMKELLKDWTSSCLVPEEEDVKLVRNWICFAVGDLRLTEALFILKYFLRLVANKNEAQWKNAGESLVSEAQQLVKIKYGSRLDIRSPCV